MQRSSSNLALSLISSSSIGWGVLERQHSHFRCSHSGLLVPDWVWNLQSKINFEAPRSFSHFWCLKTLAIEHEVFFTDNEFFATVVSRWKWFFCCCTIFISVGVLFSKSAVDDEHAAVVDHVSALNNSACWSALYWIKGVQKRVLGYASITQKIYLRKLSCISITQKLSSRNLVALQSLKISAYRSCAAF